MHLETALGCHGILREGDKGGKGRNQGHLGIKSLGKWMDERIKGSGFIYAGGWSVQLSGLAQCPVTTVSSVFSLNSISNSSSGGGTPQLVCMCVGGPDVSSWAGTRGPVCPGASSWGDLSETGQVPATSLDQGQSLCVPGVAPGASTGEPVRASRAQATPARE